MVRQSERGEIYKRYVDKLLEEGSAVEKDGAVIFSHEKERVTFEDLIRGEISFEEVPKEIVIMKSDGSPTYNFAVVVDDFEMGITHVIRGEDHISNTPRQIVLGEAIGAPKPLYAHIPLILAPDRSKLSKRHGAVSVLEYKDKGILPEALINYLALLGWNPGTDQEIFTLPNLIEEFDLSRVHKGGAIFDEKKLDWVNKEHMKLLPEEEKRALLLERIKDEPYMVGEPDLVKEKIIWKDTSREDTIRHLEQVLELIDEDGAIMKYAEDVGKGSVLWPLRYALSGSDVSPDPITLVSILGKEKSISRINNAIRVLKS